MKRSAQSVQRTFVTRAVPFMFAWLFVLPISMVSCDSSDDSSPQPGTPQQLVTGLQGTSGSTVGPDGALYIPEAAVGKISRIDPKTGDATTFTSGLPPLIPAVGIGGAMDIAFLDNKAYVLVTLVGPDVGGSDIVGIYRIDDAESHTVIADIGTYSMDNPPDTEFFIPTGVQYAMQSYNGGFLVTDGHHNRILFVTLGGNISEFKTFDNIVPTGLAINGNTIYMAEAGPAPHLPQDGVLVSFNTSSPGITDVASGSRLLVDVEFNANHALFALSQGVWDGEAPGSPANPDTGSLVYVNSKGILETVIDNLDRPTSLEFIDNTAYIITLTGTVWKVDNVIGSPFGG